MVVALALVRCHAAFVLQQQGSQAGLASRRSGMMSMMAEDPRIADTPKFRPRPRQYKGKCFVVGDNIDTDQIIPAEYLTLVPSKVRL